LRLPTLAADVGRAVCGGRHLTTRNELRPFPGPDSYALLYLLMSKIDSPKINFGEN